MMDTWPVSLQQKIDSEGFEYKPGKTSIRSEMDIGPEKVRSRFTDAVDLYSCSVVLDFNDVATFKVFYKTTLNNGVNQFLFVDPFTEVEAAFRFIEPPSIRPLGGRVFRLTMSWEKMP